MGGPHIREHLGGGKASEEVTEELLAIVRQGAFNGLDLP
jgi:hypothetical protein